MKRMGFAGVVLAVLCLTLLMPTGAPATQHTCRVVGAGGSYGTLQEAVDAASAGDTLEVTGTCYGDTVMGKDLSIVGRGAATLVGTGGTRAFSHVVYISFGNVVAITGLTITGGT